MGTILLIVEATLGTKQHASVLKRERLYETKFKKNEHEGMYSYLKFMSAFEFLFLAPVA